MTITKLGDGDLTKKTPMADYHKEFQFELFSVESMTNYSVNIYDDASTLSIVTTSG